MTGTGEVRSKNGEVRRKKAGEGGKRDLFFREYQ
jgi:hypothetical protein